MGCSNKFRIVDFDTIRPDWYRGNGVMPRFLCAHVAKREKLICKGFPRQWIPVFEYFGVHWQRSIPPKEHLPFFSDLSEEDLISVIANARRTGKLRILVESASMYDSVISDCLYIVDNKIGLEHEQLERDISELQSSNRFCYGRALLLNGWQSYGRPILRALEAEVMSAQPTHTKAIVLPCALKRPYDTSRTHKRLYRIVEEQGYDVVSHHRIVVTSLGVIPEELWSHPAVLAYDAGVPDIYRILRLVRQFFSRNQYEYVVDCLQFNPYSDVLRIVEREGIIREIKRVNVPRKRQFYQRW